MQLHPGELYHVYNRGNNRKRLFYERKNYPCFLTKIRQYITPHCDLLAYSLMPNHFHFLIQANEKTIAPWNGGVSDFGQTVSNAKVQMSRFSHGIQMLLSSYAKAINHQYKRTGSLFTQNTHAKQTSSDLFLLDYSLWCFLYIHNNPVVSGLVSSPGKWMYSSYREYMGWVEEPLCNIELGKQLLSLDINKLSSYNHVEIPEYVLCKIL